MSARLSCREYERLLDGVRELHACRTLEDFPQLAMRECRAMAGCDSVSYNEMPLRPGGKLVGMAEPDIVDSPELRECWTRLKEQHPVLLYMRETGDGSARRISDFLDRRQFHASALYQEFFRHFPVEHQLALSIRFTGETVVGIAMNRERRDFSERSRLAINLLRTHLAQAYASLCDRRALTGRSLRLEEALEATGQGVVLFSDRGVLLHVTGKARMLLARFFGWRGGTRLAGPLEDWARRSRAVLRKTGLAGAGFETRRGETRLQVRLTDRAENHFSLLHLHEKPDHIPSDRLMSLGLTVRESEVLSLLAEGKSNTEIGVILGISAKTVKTHVQNLLEILDVPNRTAAAREALETVNVGGPMGR